RSRSDSSHWTALRSQRSASVERSGRGRSSIGWGWSAQDRTLQPSRGSLHGEAQAGLLDAHPVHDASVGRQGLLQAVISGKKVVGLRLPAKAVADGENVAHISRSDARVLVVETALIGVDAPAVRKIVKESDDPRTGGDAGQLNRALLERPADQRPMKFLEERPLEGMRLAAPLPGCDVEPLQALEERECLIDAAGM